MKKIVMLIIGVALFFSGMGINAVAKEVETDSVIYAYDYNGELIETFKTEEELNDFLGISKARKAGGRLAVAKVLKEVGEELLYKALVEGIENAYNYLKNLQISIPTLEVGQTATVYSLDGNIYNPYPPNSYQYTTWARTNFIVVVE